MFVCSLFFFSHFLGCIYCAVKKCVIPLSEPLDDHRPRQNFFEEVDLSGAAKWYCHNYAKKNTFKLKFENFCKCLDVLDVPLCIRVYRFCCSTYGYVDPFIPMEFSNLHHHIWCVPVVMCPRCDVANLIFRRNTLGKEINCFTSPPSYGVNSTASFFKGWI